MSKIIGSIAGALLALLAGTLVLVASQDEACAEDWWTCSPGGVVAQRLQMLGIGIMLLGPFVGLRIGSWLGPKIDPATGAGIAAGALPGLLTLLVGWWLPVSALVILLGATVGGVIGHSRSASAQDGAR